MRQDKEGSVCVSKTSGAADPRLVSKQVNMQTNLMKGSELLNTPTEVRSMRPY